MFISIEFFKNLFLITCFFHRGEEWCYDDGDKDDDGEVLDENQKL